MAWSTASGRQEIEAALRRAGGEDEATLDLAGTARLFAALERPQEDLAPYRRHLDRLVADVAGLAVVLGAEDSLPDRLATLQGVLVEKHGYLGDETDYDNLDNADLLRVIDRRRGLPVALGILYLHCARRRGWEAAGLAFPGHFLVRLSLRGERAIIDLQRRQVGRCGGPEAAAQGRGGTRCGAGAGPLRGGRQPRHPAAAAEQY